MRKTSSRWFELVQAFPLRPLSSEKDLDGAVKMINNLVDQPRLTKEETDYLDVLGDLVEDYEDTVHPMVPPSPDQMLAHLMESRGVTQRDVSNNTGIAASTISSLLSKKRRFSFKHAKSLAIYFKVKADIFVLQDKSEENGLL